MASDNIHFIAKGVGGITALAKRLGISKGAVSQWERVPVDRVVSVEAATGIPREILRPDVFRKQPDA